jgi:hypothetical protein
MRARLPLADAEALQPAWRRTRRLRRLLALALVALVIAAAALATRRHAAQEARFLPRASNGIVVLDLSASISSDTFNRIGETLTELAATNRRYGLVVFSDVAYEALPPGTPSSALRPYARYFRAPEQSAPGLAPAFPTNPWTNSFSAGTRISAGLGLALGVIRSDRLQRPGVILISDLDDDSGDDAGLRAVALAYRREAVRLKVVALNPSPDDERRFAQLLGSAADIGHARLPGERSAASGERFPLGLTAIAIAIAFALAANELLDARLTWDAAT